jgi:OOP family OmpA-OmpF porin
VRAAVSAAAPNWIASRLKSDIALSVDGGAAGAAAASDSLLDEQIEFALGAPTVPEGAKAHLNDIASVLKDDERTIIITGHTDNQGDAQANRTLSLERA